MRVGFVRKAGLGAVLIAAAALGACNDDPISWDPNDTTDLFVNPTVMVVPAGREAKLASRAVNPGNEPTFAAVEWAIDPTAGCVEAGVNVASVTVTDDPDRLPIQPPGLFVVTGENTLGQTCILLTSGGGEPKTVRVTVVGDDMTLVCPDAVRAGATGTLNAALIANDSTLVTPFDQATDVVWASDDSDVVSVDSNGDYVATESGTAEISATWSGTAGTGTTGTVTLTATCSITVGGSVPASAAFADADTLGSLGTYVLGDTLGFEVEVFDAQGNLTFDPDEITGITVESSDPGVATATATRVELTEEQVVLTVTAIPVGSGVTTISGVVETTEGDLPYSASLAVAAPDVTGIVPDPAAPADVLTVTGSGLSLPGIDPEVTFNGFAANSVTVVSPTELTVEPPLFGDGGTVSVVVSVGGVEAGAITYEQNGQWDAEDYEPENDDLPTTVNIGSPLNFTGSVSPDDVDDFFRVVVTENTTFDLTMGWDDAGADLDIAFVNEGFTAYVCSDGATGANPENTTCSLTPGTYYLWINFYDGPGVANYTVTTN